LYDCYGIRNSTKFSSKIKEKKLGCYALFVIEFLPLVVVVMMMVVVVMMMMVVVVMMMVVVVVVVMMVVVVVVMAASKCIVAYNRCYRKQR